MLPGPVFNVELITTARRARYFVLRFTYGLILLYFIVQTAPWHIRHRAFATFQEMAELGAQVFATVSTIQGIAILLLTPAMVAGVIAEEKRRKTLHYLLASTLSSGEIILGKLSARLLHLGVFLTIGLPILILATLFGGVNPDEVWLLYAGTASTTFFLASLSLLVSVYSNGAREAISLAYLLELGWLFLPIALSFFLPLAGGIWAMLYEVIQPLNDWIGWSSPVYVLYKSVRFGGMATIFEPVFWMIGLQVGSGALFLSWAVVRLRPGFRNEGSKAGWASRVNSLRRGRRLLPRPACGDHAMLWKERYVSRMNAPTKFVSVTLGLILVALLAYSIHGPAWEAYQELVSFGYGDGGSTSARARLNEALRLIGALIYVVWGIAIAVSAATSLTSEREGDTWTSLIATPLTGWEILGGKMFGAVWGTRWIGLVLLGYWTLGLGLGAIHPLGYVLALVVTTIYLWFALSVGLFLSLKLQSSGKSMAATMAVLITTNLAYLMCCIPIEPHSAIVAVGITPMFVAGAPMGYDELSKVFLNTPDPHERELVAAGFVSVILYSFAAGILTSYSIGAFDKAIGRPNRGLGSAEALGKPARPASSPRPRGELPDIVDK